MTHLLTHNLDKVFCTDDASARGRSMLIFWVDVSSFSADTAFVSSSDDEEEEDLDADFRSPEKSR